MKAQRLIEAASFGPDELKIIARAFDEAWRSLACNYTGPLAIEAARLKLANAILSAAHVGRCEVEALKTAGLRAMK